MDLAALVIDMKRQREDIRLNNLEILIAEAGSATRLAQRPAPVSPTSAKFGARCAPPRVRRAVSATSCQRVSNGNGQTSGLDG